MRSLRKCMFAQTLLLAFLTVGLISTVSRAGSNADTKILLHLTEATTKNPCLSENRVPSCADIVTAGQLFPVLYNAHVLVADADPTLGVACMQFGIAYDGPVATGVDVFAWTNCADLDFHLADWPGSGSGNLICWDYVNNCRRNEPGGPGTGVVGVYGYFYCAAYTPGTLNITLRPADGRAGVSSCTPIDEYYFPASHLGSVAFSDDGTTAGYNPCNSPISIESTTWSRIKLITSP